MFSPVKAVEILSQLRNIQDEKSLEMSIYGNEQIFSSDDDGDSESPIFDSFYHADGSQGILNLCNFDALQFHSLFSMIRNHVHANWNTGRGPKRAVTPKDVTLMTLCVLKHGGQWDFLAGMFGFKAPMFQKMISTFMDILSPFLYEKLVDESNSKYRMKDLQKNKTLFKKYPSARYATDVTFQQSNRPGGNMQEGKLFFSGKHKLYGLKLEVSVLPNGLAINCTHHYPGSVADLSIMLENSEFHLNSTTKSDEDETLQTHTTSNWGKFCDKGYQGAQERFRCIISKKKPRGRFLTPEEVQENAKISSDRIIVENYFGRMCMLWNVMTYKYRWSIDSYDTIAKLCVSLTNFHIGLNPLREDHKFYYSLLSRHKAISQESVEKRENVQKSYRCRRRTRLRVQFYSVPDSNTSGISSTCI